MEYDKHLGYDACNKNEFNLYVYIFELCFELSNFIQGLTTVTDKKNKPCI
jgi:hypothetical protein